MKPLAQSWDWMLITLSVLAAVLMLASLDNGYLWQDEAETALLARNIVRFGYPRVFDGQHSLEIPTTYGQGLWGVWIYSPWLPFYLLAGIFSTLGESTWAARLPFALFGLLTVYLSWRLVCRLTNQVWVRRLSVLLLVCSVPFLLHMRQCRYYALTSALLIGGCLAYLALLRDPTRKRWWYVGGLLVLLFHANFGTFLPFAGAIILHYWLWGRSGSRAPFLWMWLGVAALTVPAVLLFYRQAFVGDWTLGRPVAHLAYYVRTTNKYLLPIVALGGMTLGCWVLARARRRVSVWKFRPSREGWFLILVVASQLAFLLIPDQRHMRYLIPTVPILLIAEAFWVRWLFKQQRVLGWLAVLLALCPTLLHRSTQPILMTEFIYELTHPYVGPMEGIVGYLRVHAAADQTVKIPYDERTLMFYTDLKIEPPSEFTNETYPDWIILRRQQSSATKAFMKSSYCRRIEAQYDRIVLDAPDAYWQNREDPGEHHFRTMQEAPRVVIYRKRGSQEIS